MEIRVSDLIDSLYECYSRNPSANLTTAFVNLIPDKTKIPNFNIEKWVIKKYVGSSKFYFRAVLTCLRGEIPGIHAGDETSLTRDTSCEILNIWTRKPSVRKVVKRTAGQAGIVCGANIRRDVTISHSAVKQKDRDVSSGITVLQGGEDVKSMLFYIKNAHGDLTIYKY